MGHVDHGKTSLLDAIRKANVTASEAGGITQHIGAYQVTINGKKIVFLDTPGHEAFTEMRARGAKVTDVAVLVVAADDGVMPQTIEAINHAKAANIPIIVAINKIDKPNANPDRVKQQLSEYGLIPEDWGGDTVCVPVSAINKKGINTLLEMILLVAEMCELKANPKTNAVGTIIEAKLDKGRGPVATVIVQKGTLYIGDAIVAGTAYGRVRAMIDDKGKRLKEAGPSVPVEVLGLSDVPNAGDLLYTVKDEKLARQIAEKRKEKQKESELKQANQKVTLDKLFQKIQKGEVKELNIIIKGDVQGSVEALIRALEKLSYDKVKVKVIHGAVGSVTESDVMLASASNAIIIGFNVRPEPNAKKIAEKEKVDIRTYRVIYNVIDDIELAMKGMLEPSFREAVIGRAEVRATFKVPGVGIVAGCYVLEGQITRNSLIRVIRDGIIVYEGKLDSLKRFKDDVKEVNEGYECGIGLEKFNDIKEGDILEAVITEKVTK
jgi:translation initiation factor IF-2